MFVSISGVDYYAFNTWGDILPTTWATQLSSSWALVKGPNDSQVMMNSSPMVRDLVEDRSTADFSIWDPNHSYRFTKGEYVEITDVYVNIIFDGYIETAIEKRLTPDGGIEHRITCVDNHYLADKRLIAKAFVSGTVADAVNWIITNILAKTGEDEGVTAGTITAPTPIESISFDYVPVSQALDELAELAGCTWWIETDKTLNFHPRSTVNALWQIAESGTLLPDVIDGSFSKESGNPEYRNVQYIRGGQAKTTDIQTELKKGDGETTSWAVGYKLAEEPDVYVKIGAGSYVAKTVGIKGVETGKDFYWSANDQVILQDGTGTVLTSADSLKIEYYGLYDIVIRSKDYGAIADRKLVEFNTSGMVEMVKDDPLVKSLDAGIDVANAILDHYATIGTKISYSTFKTGLEVGTLQHITSAIHDLDDDFLITQVEKCPLYYDDLDLVNPLIQYNITAVSGPVEDYWTKVFLNLNRGTAGGSIVSSASVVAQIEEYSHQWTDPDSFPDIWAHAVADGTFQVDDALVPSFAVGDEISYMALWNNGSEQFRKYRTSQDRSTPGEIFTMFIVNSGEFNDQPWDEIRFYGGDNASATTGSGTLIYNETFAERTKNSLESLQIEFTALSY
jgi:hypothetical protein